MERRLDVVHVGAASRDLTEADPRGWRLGGGVTYASLTTARLGLATGAAIGLDALAAGAWELDALRDAGVEVVPVPLPEGPVFANEERPTGRVQLAHRAGVRLPADALPDHWASAGAWSVVPVADELPEGLAGRIPERGLVALGWQGLLRTLRSGEPVTRRPPRGDRLVARADLVGLSRDDIEPTVELVALTGLLRDGARLAVTDGSAGGELIDVLAGLPAGRRPYASVPVGPEVDATGAGDVFLAALLAAVLGEPRGVVWPTDEQLRFAAAAAAIVVGGPGLEGVPADAAAIRRVAANAAPAAG